MVEELAYSIHLGSDKNRTNKAKEIAKNNPSETTSFSNNGIQNSQQLSKVNKHNLRDYDKKKDDIFIVRGTDNLVYDVQQVYLQEFEQSRIDYNNKQKRDDRKINNYFKHISDSDLWDLACEFIVELGDMDFWQDKDNNYRIKMTDVYNEQVNDLMKIVPAFKVANAVIHFDEVSPHLHIVGVPVSDNNKRGMKKQVAKSKIFTKQSLTELQDKMRNCCIKSYNKFYEKESTLKHKQKGRNIDVKPKDMGDYKIFKKQYSQNRKKVEKATENIDVIDNSSKEVYKILNNLKPTRLNKNNSTISNENVEIIKNYIEDVTSTNKSIRGINGVNNFIDNFEKQYHNISVENSSLNYQIEQKDKEIQNLERDIFSKDKTINNLQAENTTLKGQLKKFKDFWYSIMNHFHTRVCFDKDENYKIVSDDLYKIDIFSDDEMKIATNINRKVMTQEDLEIKKNTRNKNDDIRF